MRILKGVSVSPGKACGSVKILKDEIDPQKITKEDIIVLPYSHPMFTMAVMNAAAVICEVGGRLSHLCVVSLEMGIPCVTQVKDVTMVLKNGQYIVVNADEGEIIIYE